MGQQTDDGGSRDRCYAARFPGMPGYGAVSTMDHPKCAAESVLEWLTSGAVAVEVVTIEQARAGMDLYICERMRRRASEPTQGALL